LETFINLEIDNAIMEARTQEVKKEEKKKVV